MFLISEKAINVYCGCLPKILQFKWSNNLKFSHIVIRIKTTVQTLRARKILFIFKVTVHIQKKFHSIKKLKMFMVWKNFTLHFRTIIFWSCGFKRNRPSTAIFSKYGKCFSKTLHFEPFISTDSWKLSVFSCENQIFKSIISLLKLDCRNVTLSTLRNCFWSLKNRYSDWGLPEDISIFTSNSEQYPIS